MHEQFYKRAFKFSDGRTGKTDVSLTESDSDTVRTVKKLGACNFISTEVEVTGLYLYRGRRSGSLLRAVIYTCRSIDIVIFLKSGPSWIDGNKTFEDSFRDDLKLRQQSFISVFRITDKPLYCNEVIP